MKLNIEKSRYGAGLDLVKITGFGDGELSELKSMEHYEAKDTIIGMLDSRNNGVGTCWACGNGIYGMWFDNEAVYMNIGTGSD